MKKQNKAGYFFALLLLAFLLLIFFFWIIGTIEEASAATLDSEFVGPRMENGSFFTPEYVGYHDKSDCENMVYGWVIDKNAQERQLKVAVYRDWPYDSLLTEKIAEVTANELRTDLPYNDQHHGFSLQLPEKYLNDTYTYYVYVLDDNGQPVKLLNRSEKMLYCGDEDHLFDPGDHIWIMVYGLNIRTGPGEEYSTRYKSSKWMNFRIEEIVYDSNEEPWYRIGGDDERLKRFGSSRLYITADPHYIKKDKPIEVSLLQDTVKRWIDMDRSGPLKKVSVYEENAEGVVTKRAEFPISTGLRGRTPIGNFRVYVDESVNHRRRVDHMRGADFDLTGIGYVMYFDGSRAFHVRYWRLNQAERWYVPFGGELSHGCVNEPPDAAKWLWYWMNSTLPGEEYVPVISR
jgi:hypothetical protein